VVARRRCRWGRWRGYCGAPVSPRADPVTWGRGTAERAGSRGRGTAESVGGGGGGGRRGWEEAGCGGGGREEADGGGSGGGRKEEARGSGLEEMRRAGARLGRKRKGRKRNRAWERIRLWWGLWRESWAIKWAFSSFSPILIFYFFLFF